MLKKRKKYHNFADVNRNDLAKFPVKRKQKRAKEKMDVYG
jgi:hypothetical protein